ncbi:MAG TPA: hypothetical protein VLG69_02720 [Candidatus Andersenbacteria bacterium]|nr:hypothetical protein [Candidatus Andersenbacteria bacterium]
MKTHPFINAIAAILYIVLIALGMNYVSKHAGPDNNFLAPIAFLSLFTFSAAVMGFLFVSQPIRLYFDGKKKEAVEYFLQTLLFFGCITIILFLVVLSGVGNNK